MNNGNEEADAMRWSWARPEHAAAIYSGNSQPRSVVGAGRVGTMLEIEPEHWWLGWMDGHLVVDATRIEPYVDPSGVVWVVVEGWRRLAHGGRRWSRDLVHPAALPPELLPDDVTVARALPHDRHPHR